MEEPNIQHSSVEAAGQEKIWRYFQNEGVKAFDHGQPRIDRMIRVIQQKAGNTPPKVLNIGIGNGAFEEAAVAQGWDVTALDPDEQAVARLTARQIPSQVGSIGDLPFSSEKFDFVVATEVLEHLDEELRRQGLQEVARVLRPRGWFLGTVPFNEDLSANTVVCPCCGTVFHRWGHQVSFTLDSMRQQLQPWFAEVSVEEKYFIDWRNRSLIWKVKALLRIAVGHSAALVDPNIEFNARKA